MEKSLCGGEEPLPEDEVEYFTQGVVHGTLLNVLKESVGESEFCSETSCEAAM